MTTRALEDPEIQAIFNCVDGCNAKRNEALLITGIGMALRASELVGLQIGDCLVAFDTNFRNGCQKQQKDVYDGARCDASSTTPSTAKSYVTIRAETAKFNKERTIRIGDDIQDTIMDFTEWKIDNGESVEKGAPMFVSQKGGYLTRIALFQLVKEIFYKAGINQSPHCLRKTGATLYYIESDYDLIATQQFLGHADPSTTRRYIGLTSEQIAEYSERMSDHLFSAILGGKFNRNDNMLNFNPSLRSRAGLTEIPTAEMIVELQARGIDMTSAISQMQAERKPKMVAVAGSKVSIRKLLNPRVVAFPRRE